MISVHVARLSGHPDLPTCVGAGPNGLSRASPHPPTYTGAKGGIQGRQNGGGTVSATFHFSVLTADKIGEAQKKALKLNDVTHSLSYPIVFPRVNEDGHS
jgi:hypothetical protein